MEKEKEKTVKGTNSNGLMFLYGIIGVVVLALVIAGGVAVKSVDDLSQNSFVLKVANVLNLSAAKINGMKVSYVDYIDDLNTLNKFYANTPEVPTPTDEQVSDQVLSRLLANKLIGKIADEYDVKVINEDVAEFKTNLLKQFDSEEAAEEELMNKYGWTLAKYMEKVVNPILLEQKLQKAFDASVGEDDEDLGKYDEEQVSANHILFAVQDEANREKVKTEAENVLQQIKDGADFAEMASKFSADSANKDNGGSLGFFGRGQMVPEFETAVFSLEPGQLNEELVETTYGFHIVKLDDKRTVKNYFAFMDDQFKNADIKVLIPVHNPFEELQADTQAEVGEDDIVEITDEPIDGMVEEESTSAEVMVDERLE